MRIEKIHAITGPNIYSYRPVLVMRLHLDTLTERESKEFPGFNQRLLELLPGMNEHVCGKGYAGGFVERLAEGTYFGHIVEHVALELTELAGVPTFHGKTRQAGEPGCYRVIVEYKAEKGTEYLLRAAVALVEALLREDSFALDKAITEAKRIIEQTEPEPCTHPSACIPIISVTGTKGKTTITRLIANLIAETGATIGMTTTDGTYLNGKLIRAGDATDPRSVQRILSDPMVDVAVLEVARDGIMRSGLAYDWSDISVLSNIQPDHSRQDGITSVEDILYVKSLVAERVREGGTLILNADDERLATLMEVPRVSKIPKTVIYYSLNSDNPLLQQHTAQGGIAFCRQQDRLMEMRGVRQHPIVAAVPITPNGQAGYQVSNTLAAIAAARAYGLTHKEIVRGLKRHLTASFPIVTALCQDRDGEPAAAR